MVKSRPQPLPPAPDAAAETLRALLAQVDDRIAQVDAQAARARELLADVRGATKELTHAIRESRTAFAGLSRQAMADVLETDLDKARTAIDFVVKEAEASIIDRFDKLYNMLMTGHENGRTRPGEVNVEEAVRREAEWREARKTYDIAMGYGQDANAGEARRS